MLAGSTWGIWAALVLSFLGNDGLAVAITGIVVLLLLVSFAESLAMS